MSIFADMDKAIQGAIDAETNALDGAKDWTDFQLRVGRKKGLKAAQAIVRDHMKLFNKGDSPSDTD